MSDDKTKKYVVVASGLQGTKVGDELDLTKAQAQARVGKVVLKTKTNGPKVSDDVKDNKIAKLKGELKEATDYIEKANKGGGEMAETIKSLTSDLEASNKKAEETAKSLEAANKKVDELTKAAEAAKKTESK